MKGLGHLCIRPAGDADFSRERFRQAYESEIAGQLGNLAHRVLRMIERYCNAVVPAPPEGLLKDDRLLRAAAGLPEAVAGHLRAFAFDRALDAIWALVADANRYVAEQEPWALAGQAAAAVSPEAGVFTGKLHGCLFSLAVALQAIAHAAAPLLPGSSLQLARKLGRTDGKSGDCHRPEPPSALIGSRVEARIQLFPTATP